MKIKYLLLVVCWLTTAIGSAQNATDQLFAKYADEKEVTSVYISKSMLQLLPVSQLSVGLNFDEMKGKIESLYVLSSEDEGVGKKLRKDFNKLVKDSSYEELMRVKDEDSLVVVYACKDRKKNKISELLLIVDDEDEFCGIRLLGSFTLDDLRGITNKQSKEKNDD